MCVRVFWIWWGCSIEGAGVLDKVCVFGSGRGCSRSECGCSGYGAGVLECMHVF